MLDLISFKDFQKLLKSPRGNYYTGRWAYYKAVINLVSKLKVASVIELGPGCLPILKDSDLMLSPDEDQFGRPPKASGRVIVHDATVNPWPVDDKQYDLFIALQVWEHLDNKQSRAFREVMRISRMAILSFPYAWKGGLPKPSHRAHRDIDKQLIRDWTLNIPPREIIEIPRAGPEFSKGPRLIYFWEFS